MVQIPDELKDALWADTERMSGTVCFRNTRVPVQALFDTLYHGEALDDFEGVQREQALAVIRWEQFEARRAFGIPVPA